MAEASPHCGLNSPAERDCDALVVGTGGIPWIPDNRDRAEAGGPLAGLTLGPAINFAYRAARHLAAQDRLS